MSVDRVLHPLVDWLADRGQFTFARHCAPVLQLGDGHEPGEVMIVFQGTIPNQKGVQVLQELVAVLHREASDDKTINQPRADVPSSPVG